MLVVWNPTPASRTFAQAWFDHVAQYSEREQLSFNYVASKFGESLRVGYFSCAQMAQACTACADDTQPMYDASQCRPRWVTDAAMWHGRRSLTHANRTEEDRAFIAFITTFTHHLIPPRPDSGCRALAMGAHPKSENASEKVGEASRRARAMDSAFVQVSKANPCCKWSNGGRDIWRANVKDVRTAADCGKHCLQDNTCSFFSHSAKHHSCMLCSACRLPTGDGHHTSWQHSERALHVVRAKEDNLETGQGGCGVDCGHSNLTKMEVSVHDNDVTGKA